MASTYSPSLGLELPGTGDQAGTWGITTNTNLGTLVEQAIAGYVTQAVSTGGDTTITIPNGATGVARNMYIELTGTGGSNTNLIVPANKKLYFIFNNTASGQVTVKVSGETGVSVPNKAKMILVSNGTDIVDATNYVGNLSAASATITNLSSSSATITNLLATSATITTLTNNPTFGGGTANGVLYLNGSKVATSGSAVTYDGTTFGTTGAANFATSSGNVGIGTSSPTAKLDVVGGAAINGTDSLWLQRPVVPSFEGQGAPGIVWRFYTTGTTYTAGAMIQGLADAAWSSTSAPTSIRFYTTPSGSTTLAERFRIDNAGNLGLGVTPSAWTGTGAKAIQVGTYASLMSGTLTGYTDLGHNIYGNYSYLESNYASFYRQISGQHIWFTAPSGTAGNAITFGDPKMTLNADGQFLVGATAAVSARGEIRLGGNASGSLFAMGRSGTNKFNIGVDSSDNVDIENTANTPIRIYTNATERARITAGGDLLVACTSSTNTASTGGRLFTDGAIWSTMAASTDGGGSAWLVYSTGAAANRFYVGLGGTVFATNTTISAISDNRYKENVRDLDVGLDAVMALKPRKFDWKEGKGKDIKDDRGFIAQEFEQVFPDLVDEWKDPAPEGEEPYKSVRQDLIPVLVKAIQELKAELDEAKAKIAALEAA